MQVPTSIRKDHGIKPQDSFNPYSGTAVFGVASPWLFFLEQENCLW